MTIREEYPNGIDVYNFEVAGTSCYYVITNANNASPVLVHNACPGPGDGGEVRKQKVTKARKSAKEKKNDHPSWADGERPYVDENGNAFAKRLCDEKYGPDKYPKGPKTEYNKIRKWGDSGFENPPDAPPSIKPNK